MINDDDDDDDTDTTVANKLTDTRDRHNFAVQP